MTRWRYRLELKDSWTLYKNGKSSVQDVAGDVVKALQEIHLHNDPNLNNLREQFSTLADDPDVTESEFDDLLDDLYDWADLDHTCWIATF